MAVTVIDTVRYARRLKDAGVPAEQAEAMADAIGAELVDQLATKADIESAVATLRGEITAAAATLDGKIAAVDVKHGGAIRLLQWMLSFVLAFVVAITWRVFP